MRKFINALRNDLKHVPGVEPLAVLPVLPKRAA